MKPERVRAAAAEADRKILEMAQKNQGQAPGGADEPEDDGSPDVREAAQEPEQQAADQPPSDKPGSSDSEKDAEIERLQKELDKANQRYRSQDGMLRARDQELQKLSQRLEEMERRQEQAQSQPAEPPQPAWSDKDEDAFGTDLVKYIHDVAARVAREAVGSLPQDVADLKSGLSKTTEMTAVSAKDSFEAKLTKLAPEWRSLDQDQAFIAWLEDRPTLHKTFHAAVQGLDAAGVADVFNTYSELAGTRTKSKSDRRREELEQQAAPRKQRQSAPAPAEAAPEDVWALSEIQQVYRTKRGRDGRQLTPEEWDALEREIAAAQAQGRVDYQR